MIDRRGAASAPQRGAAALEAAVVLGLVMLPLVVALVTAARWVEYRSAADGAADEAARALALEPAGGAELAAAVVAAVEAGHGLEPGSLSLLGVEVGEPGGVIVVRVAAHLPALVVPFGSWGAADLDAEGIERRPDYGADS